MRLGRVFLSPSTTSSPSSPHPLRPIMSLALSALRQCLPAASHWMPEKDMPDLTGKARAPFLAFPSPLCAVH